MRLLVFLLAPAFSFGLLYFHGWKAIAAMVLLAACTLVLSRRGMANPPCQTEDPTLSSYGVMTTLAGRL